VRVDGRCRSANGEGTDACRRNKVLTALPASVSAFALCACRRVTPQPPRKGSHSLPARARRRHRGLPVPVTCAGVRSRSPLNSFSPTGAGSSALLALLSASGGTASTVGAPPTPHPLAPTVAPSLRWRRAQQARVLDQVHRLPDALVAAPCKLRRRRAWGEGAQSFGCRVPCRSAARTPARV